MSLSRYVGQKNVLGHALTSSEVKTLHMVEPGVMHYKLRAKGGKYVTRTFKPSSTPVMVAELEKKIRKVRTNKGAKRGPRARASPIGLAGMKIMMRRGRAPKVVRRLVTPGGSIGLAAMKIMPARKRRADAGKRRKASPSPNFLPNPYLRKVRKNKGGKRGPRKAKSPLAQLIASLK